MKKISNWRVKLSLLIFGCIVCTFSSPVESKVNHLNEKILCKIEEDEILTRYECFKLEQETSFKKVSIHKINKKSFKKSFESSKRLNTFVAYSGVNLNVDSVFRTALLQCPSSIECLVTSGKCNAKWRIKKSKHRIGKAVDLNWDSNGKAFANWLDTEEGIQWIKTYKLDYYLENISEKKGHDKYFYNRRGRGPHIHLFLK